MLPTNKIIQKYLICSLILLLACTTVKAQTTQPTWWFGVSGAANFNFYDGTTQRLDNSFIVPSAFHKGDGVRPYGSVLVEYRPGRIWGFMLNVGYDGRGAKLDDVIAPCNCPATLKTDISYVSVEPSLRLGFNSSNLYFFAGPRLAFGLQNDYAYTQLRQPNTNGELSAMHKTILSGQIGAGYDITVSSANSATAVSLSPFVSYHPYFGQEPRTIESLSVSTVRAGVALKFGKRHKSVKTHLKTAVILAIPVHEVTFSVRAPKAVPLKRQVSETLPLLNTVFFDEGSTEIPSRYVLLTKDQSSGFKEDALQKEQSTSMTGRSAGQLNMYHNILNVLGDRMRSNPGATISLNGASASGPEDGKLLAESVKQYLVFDFGINSSRIATQGRNKPQPPSEQRGGTKELVLLHAEDRRVDIESSSSELLLEVGGGMMKPVQYNTTQVDPLDSHVVFNVDSARELLKSWSIEVTDSKGAVQHYGPFTSDQESVPGKTILGDSPNGDYKIVLVGERTDGSTVRKESTVHLVRQDDAVSKGLRYSIVFDFDRAKTIVSYEKFLTDIVSPLISDGSTVIIHGHTDIIGDDDYNQKLSVERAQQTQKIIERSLTASGRNDVKFETFGFGEEPSHSPFENNLPEERFYNRTVIIDIIPLSKRGE
ncbi:MAG: outer membrane protein OmpA [Mucilaginibacter sp.]|nr:outer membrane protein OmpA [Mucilaginibacter sp.]